MWKTVNSVYKSTSKNIKKLSKSIPNMSSVTQSIQKINISNLSNIIPTKSVSSKQSQIQKAMKSIFNNKKPVMPIKKMSLVAQMSYESENFDFICEKIIERLKVFKYNTKQAKKSLNTLVLLSYLIKNAPSGFVDQFRQQVSILNEHSQLSLQNSYITDDKEIQKLKPLLVEIRQRAKYIVALLTDKKKLLKQKEIAMEIKKKIIESAEKQNMFLGNDQKTKILSMGDSNSQATKKSTSEKIQSFLQHYVWTYWNKFDQKMQNLTEKIIQKIDQYLDMQQPQSFEIDEIDDQKELQENQQHYDGQSFLDNRMEQKIIREQKIYLKQKNELDIEIKLQQQGPVLNTDLI